MRPQEAYRWLLEHNRETAYLASFARLAGWDQATYTPKRGHAHRAQMQATLAKLLHQRATEPRIGEMLAVVEGSGWLGASESVEAVNVREWRRAYERECKIPQRLAVELAQATSEGEAIWQEARPRNDTLSCCILRLWL